MEKLLVTAFVIALIGFITASVIFYRMVFKKRSAKVTIIR